MHKILNIIQIIISVLLICCILIQQRGGGGAAVFGGGAGESYYTKRGFEKILFVSTIILAGLFLILAFVNLLI
ncbi:preprotein translocase subunit SecG [bacterium]|nr:preprotein translocase subunit SecG [bacterium]